MRPFFIKLLFLGISASLIMGCKQHEEQDDEFQKNIGELMSKKIQDESNLQSQLSNEIIRAIPSPIQLTSALKAANIAFTEQNLNKTGSITNYNSGFSKALNLGVYGADLGYINFYDKNSHAIKSIQNIKLLSEDLKVSQFFDFELINKLAKNSKNIDSLIYISAVSFSNMDDYLKKNNRRDVSLLIIYGGWIESMYLLTASKNKVSAMPSILKERIGEQKIVIENLVKLFDIYKNVPKYRSLIKNLDELNEIYQGVSINVTEGETERKIVDGILQFVETSSSKVEASDETLQQIKTKIDLIRKSII